MAPTCQCGNPFDPRDANVCRNCAGTLRHDLETCADLLAHLDDKRARRGSNAPKASVGRSSDTPLPYDPRVSAVAKRARGAITTWVRIVTEEHPDHPEPPARPDLEPRLESKRAELTAWREVQKMDLTTDQAIGVNATIRSLVEDIADIKQMDDLEDLAGLTSWLLDHLDWILDQHWAGDMHGDFTSLHTTLDRLFDRPPDAIPLGPCGAEQGDGTVCDHLLAAPKDAETFACPRCGVVHNVKQRTKEAIAAAADIVVSVKEAVALLRLAGFHLSKHDLHAAVRFIGARPVLTAKPAGKGRPVDMYRLGTLRDVWLQSQEPENREAWMETRHGKRREELSGDTLNASA